MGVLTSLPGPVTFEELRRRAELAIAKWREELQRANVAFAAARQTQEDISANPK